MNTVRTNPKMAASIDFAAMNYQDLLKMSKTINSLIEDRRKEALTSILSQMAAFGITTDEISCHIGRETEVKTVNGDNPFCELQNNIEENQEESKTMSVFDNPAFKAPYNPNTVKGEASVPATEIICSAEETKTPESEDRLSTMEDSLSKFAEYKIHYSGEPSIKMDRRKLMTLDELHSGKPINKIMCMGNELDKDADYRQHARHSSVAGIIPTEMATGETGIYIG